MTPAVVVEASGAQVLPDVRDQRATITGWQAYCATNADLRSKSPIYYDLARRLFIRRGES